MKFENEQNKTVFNGVMIGYTILILHILLMVGLGVAVILIKGIYDFRWLIFTAGIVIIGFSGYLFYRRIKESNRKITDFMTDPALANRTVEISLLGGMATVKLGHKEESIQLIEADITQPKQLQAPQSVQIKELSELNRMLEDGLITREEFLQLKKEIL